MEHIFRSTDIYLPKENTDLKAWAAMACDQFTSQPDYWHNAEALVQDKPSTLHITLPEVYLEQDDVPQRIEKIHNEMERYLQQVLTRCVHGFIYVERTTESGVRPGLVGKVDLEAYSYEKGAKPPVRPSENTVVERIPPRLAVRRGAALETPHIMMLLDDEKRHLIEHFQAKKAQLVQAYDTDLMLGGGHLAGWEITGADDIAFIENNIDFLCTQGIFDAHYPQAAGDAPIAMAVGDGNHSLATAKAYWEEIKQTLTNDEKENHPARFALVELVNIHCPAIGIEPIHRAVFGTDGAEFVSAFYAWLSQHAEVCAQADAEQTFRVVTDADEDAEMLTECIKNAPHPLAVGTLEMFLADFCAQHSGVKVDYIHGEAAVRELAGKGAVGVLLPDFLKSDLFKGVVLGGVLPKKTFSMGEATEKRYYMECRKIK